MSKRAGVDKVVSAVSAAAADYDGDGLLDIFVACYKPAKAVGPDSWHRVTNGGPSLLFHNKGDGTFEEVAQKAGVGEPHFTFAGAWADYDEDGKPDLAVANDYGDKSLYHNEGGGKFKEVSAAVGVNDTGQGMGVDWGDADGDGHLDLFFANMTSYAGDRMIRQLFAAPPEGDSARVAALLRGNALFHWDGKAFKDVRASAGIADAGWAWGGGFVDVDGDGLLDLFVTNGMISGRQRADTESIYWSHVAVSSLPVPKAISELPSGQSYVERHHGQVLQSGWSFAGHQRDHLFVNRGAGAFVDVSSVSGADCAQDGRGVVFADFDNDGQPDMFVHQLLGNRHRLYANVGAPPAGFVSLDLEGVKGNRNAIGARVLATLKGAAGTRTLMRHVSAGSGYASSSDRRVLIPLSSGEKLDGIEIRWPGGAVQKVAELKGGPFFTVREGQAPVERALKPAVLGTPGGAAALSAGGLLDAGDDCPEVKGDFISTYTGRQVQLAGRWNILVLLDPSKKETAGEIQRLELSQQPIGKGADAKPPKFGALGLYPAVVPPKGTASTIPLAVVREQFLGRLFGRSKREYPVGLLVDPYGQIFARRTGAGCSAALVELLPP